MLRRRVRGGLSVYTYIKAFAHCSVVGGARARVIVMVNCSWKFERDYAARRGAHSLLYKVLLLCGCKYGLKVYEGGYAVIDIYFNANIVAWCGTRALCVNCSAEQY